MLEKSASIKARLNQSLAKAKHSNRHLFPIILYGGNKNITS